MTAITGRKNNQEEVFLLDRTKEKDCRNSDKGSPFYVRQIDKAANWERKEQRRQC